MNAFEKEYLESLATEDHTRMVRALIKASTDELTQLALKLVATAARIQEYKVNTEHLRR
jgi:hypothetical protein